MCSKTFVPFVVQIECSKFKKFVISLKNKDVVIIISLIKIKRRLKLNFPNFVC